MPRRRSLAPPWLCSPRPPSPKCDTDVPRRRAGGPENRRYIRCMGTLLVGARMLLTLVFATAGVAKLLDRSGTRRALSDFGVPASALAVGSILLPLAELATAIALIPPATAQGGGVAAAALLPGFSAGLALAMREGKGPDCHCFGQNPSGPAGRNTLLRNLALVVPAVFVAV